MTLTIPYETVSRAEFVAGLVAVGLRQISETELETPAGYRLNLGSASDFSVVRTWPNHNAFNGRFCADQQAYDIITFDDPSDTTIARYSSLAVKSDFQTTLALERIDDIGMQIARDVFNLRCPVQ